MLGSKEDIVLQMPVADVLQIGYLQHIGYSLA